MVAPQKWKEPVLTDTCHGIGEGASSPPTILSALVMKDGISANDNEYILKIENCNNFGGF